MVVIQVVDLNAANIAAVLGTAKMLQESFSHAWPDLASAIDEVDQSFLSNRLSRIAVDESGTVLGWIAGEAKYNGNVWEIHPLVVRSDVRNRGIGRTLVTDFEQQVKSRGGITITLGADDENGHTSLSGMDVYQDVAGHITVFRADTDHPYGFYSKLGFFITGIVPDANGPGKPDIYMSKRVR